MAQNVDDTTVARKGPWYTWYPELIVEINDLNGRLDERCQELGASKIQLFEQFGSDMIARSVHESNWQEGIELDYGRTKQIADAAISEQTEIQGPHLDFDLLLQSHRKTVQRYKRQGASIEEIAALNLTLAHISLKWIEQELSFRSVASMVYALSQFKERFDDYAPQLPEEAIPKLTLAFDLIDKLRTDSTPVRWPMNEALSEGELLVRCLGTEFESLCHPMRVQYLHFLHKILLGGIVPGGRLGVFRKCAVHVGNPDLFFPPHGALPGLMDEYCKAFPSLIKHKHSDPIRASARASYDFVRIHPYIDGNGRISRLIMNLVLRPYHPLVYLKADKKGRHRYHQALRRADRGNLTPLASLIAIAVRDAYLHLIAALERGNYGTTPIPST